MQSLLFLASERVLIGSIEHVLPICLGIVFSILFIKFAQKTPSVLLKNRLFNALAVVVSATVVVFHLYHIVFTSYDINTDLPLYLCSFIAILIPLFTYYKHYWMFEILVFWIIAGTLQGVITPDIAVGFPSFDYFRYWIVHLGLLSVIFYAVFVYKMTPRLKSIFVSFGALQVYVVFIIITNFILDSNYFYLNEKPKSASLLDYFGEWPYYIIVVQLIMIPMFFLIYLPFGLLQKRNKD